jgi:hypothetical protein
MYTAPPEYGNYSPERKLETYNLEAGLFNFAQIRENHESTKETLPKPQSMALGDKSLLNASLQSTVCRFMGATKSPEEETIGHPKNDAGIGNVRN